MSPPSSPTFRTPLLGACLQALQAGDAQRAQTLFEAGQQAGLTLVDLFDAQQCELELLRDEAQQAQQASDAMQRWSHQFFRQMPAAALLLSTDGLVQDLNPRACALLHLSPAQPLQATPLRRHLAPGPGEARLMHALMHTTPDTPQDVRHLALQGPQGQMCWVDLHLAAVHPAADGGASHVLCVINDLTEHLALLQERDTAQLAQQRQHFAEATSEASHRLMARVSHEFRTPLNAVMGFSDLLLRASPARSPEDTQRMLKLIREAGEHLLTLVDEVLQVNRLHGHEARRDADQGLDLHAQCESVIALLAPQAAAAHVQLTLESAPPGLPPAQAHPRKVREVLINLVSNAIKYNRPQGWVRVALSQHGQFVAVGVTDSGIGLTSEQQRHLFEPFNRLGAEQLDSHGHGLGLVITKGLMESMGGRLQVQSEPDVGSCFLASWPSWHASTPDRRAA